MIQKPNVNETVKKTSERLRLRVACADRRTGANSFRNKQCKEECPFLWETPITWLL